MPVFFGPIIVCLHPLEVSREGEKNPQHRENSLLWKFPQRTEWRAIHAEWIFPEMWIYIYIYVYIYIYLPGTQPTHIFEVQSPKTRPFPTKTRVILGSRYIYIHRYEMTWVTSTWAGVATSTWKDVSILVVWTWQAGSGAPVSNRTMIVSSPQLKNILTYLFLNKLEVKHFDVPSWELTYPL